MSSPSEGFQLVSFKRLALFDLDELRRITITAIFSDDLLSEILVLKGGNALALIYGVSTRTSLDLDFSMNSDFPNVAEARERIFKAIRNRFDAMGLVVFDEKLEPKPRLSGEDIKPWWGGYELKFKIIEREKYEALKARPDKLRIDALVIGMNQDRTFTADLSKFEYTEGKVEHELDYYTIYVYTPEMIVIEKLRAICQQMPEYTHKGHRTPRARDFHDIYSAVAKLGIDLASKQNLELARHIFDAKQVPLSLLPKIREHREFHRPDWPAVRDSVVGTIEGFDFHFDFVLDQVERLESLWMEDSPA
jgi:hypothetical protein